MRTILLHLIGLISLVHLSASEVEESTVRFNAISLSGTIRGLHFINGQQQETISIYNDTRSAQISYKGDSILSFFREDPELIDASGNSIRNIVGSVKLPPSGTYLLLFAAEDSKEESYRISVTPDDVATFQQGAYRFINLAPFDIALKLGDTTTLLPKKKYTDVISIAKDRTYQEAIMMSLVKDKKPLLSYKGAFYFDPNKRLIYIIKPKSKGRLGRIDFRVISDMPTVTASL
ncbi:MAG: hypothetical protein ACPGN3_17055 [Opitutales bacterium]